MKNPVLSKPTIHEKDGSTKIMTPNDARLRNFTYAAPLSVDLELSFRTFDEETKTVRNEKKKLQTINLGKIPIMVKSKYCVLDANAEVENISECRRDTGGYFVINGNEKVVISQDRISENKTFVFTNSKTGTAFSHIAEIRSVAESRFGVPKTTTLKLSAKSNHFGRYIRVNVHHVKHDVPLFILFKALGIESDKQILEYICYDVTDPVNEVVLKELVGSIDEASDIVCARDALEYMAKYFHINGYPREMITNKHHRLNILRNVLETEFLPHVGPDFKKKGLYLGYMTNKLVRCYLGLWPLDDRDSYINKRVDSPGVLMANLFRQYYGKMVKDMKNMVQKEINNGAWKATGQFANVINKVNVYKIIKPTVIESGLKYALATGNWGVKSNKNKQGVAQVLNRMTYNAGLSHMRRVNTPLEKSGKLVQPRKLHATQFGYICPAETPEGASVGLVKNLAMLSSITIASNSTNVRTLLDSLGTVPFDSTNVAIFARGAPKVVVNGDIIGTHPHPALLFKELKENKMSGAINVYTSVVWNVQRNELHVNTEGGRCVRPLFVVDEVGKIGDVPPKSSWKDLVMKGVIEYLDVEESNTSMIAMRPVNLEPPLDNRPHYTHLEIHPSLMLGVLAGSIPFSDHNQAPRNCYQCVVPNTRVLLANGSRKAIKDVQVGDEVVTFDPKTTQTTTTKVIHQYVRPTENKIYDIETVSGRKITATGNHNFMTTDGWKAVEDFDQKTKIGILIMPIDNADANVADYQVLDTAGFQDALFGHGVSQSLAQKHATHLEAHGLLPLRSTHPQLPTIARMIGFLWTDGTVNVFNKKHGGRTPQVQANFGSLYDAETFEADVKCLGFQTVAPIEQNRLIHGANHHTWKISHNGAFASFILALGIRTGKRCYQPAHPVPDWIINGSALVRREFIGGFQGGDGCSVQINKNSKTNTYVPRCAVTSQSIVPEYAESVKEFMLTLRDMMCALGVECIPGIKVNNGKGGKISIGFKIQDSQENLIKYMDCVGYRYAGKKNLESGVASEFLRYKLRHTKSLKDYGSWRELVEVKETSMFVPTQSVIEVENQLISDITVEHDNHSFIAGENFLSSNSAMGKQAIGIYASNFRHRFDTMAHILNYPQKPIVETKISKLVYTDEMPCGINVMVAIACMTGFNQEDSVIMNKSAIDRGLFASTYYRTYKEQNNRNHSNGEEEFFVKPKHDRVKVIKPFNYEKLGDNGFVPENTFVDAGDIIIGKCMPQKVDSAIVYKDTSVALKNNEMGFIDRNCHDDKYFTNVNGDGYTFAKVRIRNMRVPSIGDKFSSRHGQKGTIGMVYRQEDMPFTKDGITPDIIVNPHAIPSRMTIGQLMECLLGKACSTEGTYGDATPFTELTVEQIASTLQKKGMERYGNEILYNSRTGEQIATEVFIGPTFYQRLKHMTCDKVHSRSNSGPVVLLTRQPAEGRSRDGGLRVGEMEQEVHIAHGIQSFLKERFMESSDNYRVFVCKKCGFMGVANPESNIFMCKPCKNTSHFKEIRIPYAAKLLFQEMHTMSIGTRFVTKHG
jgi:DNA-directed RNA polymerase beta subunit